MINFSHYIEANIVHLGIEFNNDLYMLREDLIPYSFGGNKVRKGILFFEDIDNGDYDCVGQEIWIVILLDQIQLMI